MKFSAICNGSNDQKKGVELTNPNRGTGIPYGTIENDSRLGREQIYLFSRCYKNYQFSKARSKYFTLYFNYL